MTALTLQLRSALASGPLPAGKLLAALDISRTTLARLVSNMAEEIVTWGAGRATRYAMRDTQRGLSDSNVYRVSAEGQVGLLGVLIPVRPDGFVMRQTDGNAQHSEGFPWFASDMRPQGFLGRAYAHQHSAALGLPANVAHWSDTDALRALLANGADTVGNLLLGDAARDRFVSAPAPVPVEPTDYPRLASEALTIGETWSSAGGEQPKFCAYTARGHAIVKFTTPEESPVSQRWRDLLLAEHLALATLNAAGIAAAQSSMVDAGSQRFLEVIRFDRTGVHGRHALYSLAAMDGEFVGNASAPWPVLVKALADRRVVNAESAQRAALLYAFGALIGNTDMHSGNLSFVGDADRSYSLSPAYDMLPMGFRPTSGGAMTNTLPPIHLHPSVPHATWRQALPMANDFVNRVKAGARFSAAFTPCIHALGQHLALAAERIRRLS